MAESGEKNMPTIEEREVRHGEKLTLTMEEITIYFVNMG
jgi:hypothetical protein